MTKTMSNTFVAGYDLLMNGPNDGMPAPEDLARLLIGIDPDAKLEVVEDHGLEIHFSDGSHASITAQTMH